MTQSISGKVFLVGAGPGDPELLTIKARRLVSECDVLLYDSLIPQELLELVSTSCHLYFVGKKRGHHSIPQIKINSVLFEMAQKYKCVVRLKGGDPFLFGRGAEEASYLTQKGIPVEVVPGITAGIAVPAYMGIPVTHRLAGSSVTFVTGHEGIDKRRPTVNWRLLAKASDGIVIYMGLHNLPNIVEELIAGGLDPLTAAVVIQQGTVIGQRCIKSNLNQITKEVRKLEYDSPSIVMIGSAINYQVDACSPPPAQVTMPILF